MQKTLFINLFFLLASLISYGQLLITNPRFPLDNSLVTINCDMTRGNQGLLDYANSNDVYVHVGAITNLSTTSTDWKYVKFTWGTTNAAAKATFKGSNVYEYTINNPRSFFGVPAGETILKIAILFRNGNGSVVERNADGSDMFITIYNSALASRFLLPPFQPKYIPVPEPIDKVSGESISVSYVSNKNADLTISLNGTVLQTATNDTVVSASPVLSVEGNNQLIGEANDGVTIKKDTINFLVAPPVNIEDLPPGVRDGINYEAGDTSVILVLFAPMKTKVNVIGDFNNWTPSVNTQMNRTPDGDRHWIRLTGLQPGVEYGYQFLVDGTLTVADYYAEKILDPYNNNDANIPSSTYPDLKPYPTGQTTGIVSVLQTAKPSYSWTVTDFQRPDKRNLIIYEMLVRDFVAAQNWQTIKDTLTYLKRLGINAIELMPFNEFEGNNSWGYNPDFYFAPDKYYGTELKLKEFIDECHRDSIAVIMDIALNHSFGLSPMVQLYWDVASNRPAADNPWFNPVPKHAFNVGYDMNHESLATRYFVSRVVEHWLTNYKIDGFRFDLSKGFTQTQTCDGNGNNCNVGAWSAYDASRVAIWKRYYDTVESKSQGAYVILEHFADNTEEKELSDYGMLLWGNLNYNFNQASMGYSTDWNFDGGIYKQRGWTNPYLVTYMESHDEERLMYKNLQFGNASGTYNIKDLNTALKRIELCAAFFTMIPGPKMIWQFGELGYDYSINYCTNGTVNSNCRLDPKPIKWDYIQNASRKSIYDEISQLNKLRNYPGYISVFTTSSITYNLSGPGKWMVINEDSLKIVVVGNFDVIPASVNVTFPVAGTWYDYLSGSTITATGAAQNISLAAGAYYVYLNKNPGTPTPVRDVQLSAAEFPVKIFPNPVRKNSAISYELPESGKVTLTLMNMAGQLIGNYNAGFQIKGKHSGILDSFLNYDKNKIQSGVYLMNLRVNNKVRIEKIVLMK